MTDCENCPFKKFTEDMTEKLVKVMVDNGSLQRLVVLVIYIMTVSPKAIQRYERRCRIND